MTHQHTPGPWIHLGQGDIVSQSAPTCSADGYTDVAAVYVTSDDTSSANADLIAAAPDLLEALKKIAGMNEYDTSSMGYVVALAKAAILKATGYKNVAIT
jgi:hypothetical protein